jgi:hypothetical protein
MSLRLTRPQGCAGSDAATCGFQYKEFWSKELWTAEPGNLHRVHNGQEAGCHEYPLLSSDLARRRIRCGVDRRAMVALTLERAILIDCHFQRSAGKIANGAFARPCAQPLDRSGRRA